MAWRISLTLRNASTGAAVTGQTVQLYAADGTGALLGTFTDNTDGTYYLVMTTIGSKIGTIKVNGVIQTEKVSMAWLGEDLINHVTEATYNASGPHASLHGLGTGDGNVVGTLKVQTMTGKTLTDSSNHIAADIIDSATLAVARLPTNIPDTNLAAISTANKVQASAIELVAASGLVDSGGSGLAVLPNPTTPTLEVAAAGVQVKISATTPGLKRTADGLAIDPTTLPQIVTANTVAPSAIAVAWQDPKNFASTAEIDDAIAAIDTQLYRLRQDNERADTNFAVIYSQNAEAARNSAGASTTGGNAATQYLLGDTTALPGLLKVSIPFVKSPLLNRLIIRGHINNTTAGQTASLTARIVNAAGTLQLSLVKTVTGTTFEPINGVANIASLGSGIYWLELWLRAGANVAQLRGAVAILCNDAWITAEGDPTLWEAAEDDFS